MAMVGVIMYVLRDPLVVRMASEQVQMEWPKDDTETRITGQDQ